MRSVERVFTNIRNKNPYWSDYICFAEAIKSRGFTRPIISRHFSKLVDQDDYDKKDKNQIIQFLVSLSDRKVAEEARLRGKFRFREEKIDKR